MKPMWKKHTDALWTLCSDAFIYHAGVILDAGEACLIDPGLLPSEIDAIADFVSSRDAVPTTIVLTHCHWDHVLGPERFRDVRVLAHAEYLREVDGRQGRRTCRQVSQWETGRDIARETPFRLPRADATFDDEFVVHIGGQGWTLMHAPGHASDHIVLYEPSEGVLWSGDILSDLEIPYVCQSLVAYRRTLERLAKLEIRLLVPAHGNATAIRSEIRERLGADAAYLDELQDRIGRAVREGRSMEDTVSRCESMVHRHPAENDRAHRLNAETVYVESGGEPPRRACGWTALVEDA